MPVDPGVELHHASATNEWWRTAVIYQIYPKSWADSDGDGVGDLPGITARLPYLRHLGVDALWISPFYRSPQADGGYDVADYYDVDPVFGSLADVDRLIAAAHESGLRVFFDLVPNHTSDEHEWFQQALAAGPGSPERARYIFSDGDVLPNNWTSDFGGPAWTQLPDGQWYLHMFDRRQPDLNWAHPEVRQLFRDVLRFWLDRGVDGFRVDVAHALIKADGLPDFRHRFEDLAGLRIPTNSAPYYDQDQVHEVYRDWRQILDGYPGDRAMVAEAWVTPPDRLARYVRADEFQQAFNFIFLLTPWRADAIRNGVATSLRHNDAVGAPTTWVLSNHDTIRHASRLGYRGQRAANWLIAGEPAPDLELGGRRARAATMLVLALPGSVYLYQGEELGLPEVIELPDEVRQDPTFHRSGGARLGRDGCRVPMPWTKDAPSYGFGPGANSWLPQPERFGELAVDQQDGRPDSTFELYRTLLRIRRERHLGAGALAELDLGPELVGYEIRTPVGRTQVVLNLGTGGWPIPAAARVLAASEPAVKETLGQDQAVWLGW